MCRECDALQIYSTVGISFLHYSLTSSNREGIDYQSSMMRVPRSLHNTYLFCKFEERVGTLQPLQYATIIVSTHRSICSQNVPSLHHCLIVFVDIVEYLCHKCSVYRNHNPVFSSFMTYHRVLIRVTRWVQHVEQELLTLLENLSSPRVLEGSIFDFLYFVDRFMSFFCWPLCCLSFLDLRFLITTLVSLFFSLKKRCYIECKYKQTNLSGQFQYLNKN